MPDIQQHTEIFAALFLFSTLYAAIRGGSPERVGALIFWLGSIFSILLVSPAAQRWVHVEYGVLIGDLAMLAAFAVLTYEARRNWPLWMSSMQAIEILCHVPILLAPDVNRQAYMSLQALWAYPMLVLLVVAVRRHRARLRKSGKDISWRRSFDRFSDATQSADPESY